ncbi:MAG: TetR/AcrR family transcriptional regulator [Acidimicrobiales bacterium]|nr:MAG: TetR/AcrR family transcriptional regulator [Acidimicrobiales bacterium]
MVVNRRERVRAATVQEIKDVARAQLVTLGPHAVSLRAIAREMGMTAPALYRYFPSFDHLVKALVNDMYDEVHAAMVRARDNVEVGHTQADNVKVGHAGADNAAAQHSKQRLIAVSQAFRRWAVQHRAEFGLLFDSPRTVGCIAGQESGTGPSGAARCSYILIEIFEQLWQQQSYVVPAPDETATALLEQLSVYRTAVVTLLPVGPLNVAMSVWLRIFGLVSLEIFGHIPFAHHNAEAFFSQQLSDIMAGLDAGLPGTPS